MRERPILFTPENAQKVFNKTKTQTRRVLNPQPYMSRSNPPNFKDTKVGDLFICPDMFPTTPETNFVIAECESIGTYHCMGQKTFAEKHSPFGVSGDRLWVREAWRTWEEPKNCFDGILYKGDNSFRPIEPTREAADKWVIAHDNGRHGEKWRHARFMFRWCSRTILEITDVRIERLQNISAADAKAEGVTVFDGERLIYSDHAYIPAFATLWDSINGESEAKSWRGNPWVWALTFQKLDKPGEGNGKENRCA